MWPNPQETTDLATFTEEILSGKLYFLCSDGGSIIILSYCGITFIIICLYRLKAAFLNNINFYRRLARTKMLD